MSRRAINGLLLLATLVLIAVTLVIGARAGAPGEGFAGTDATVTTALQDQGHRPWFAPVFSPGSGEIESGLFAVQAAVGAGLLGYCIGALRSRGRRCSGSAAAESAPPSSSTP